MFQFLYYCGCTRYRLCLSLCMQPFIYICIYNDLIAFFPPFRFTRIGDHPFIHSPKPITLSPSTRSGVLILELYEWMGYIYLRFCSLKLYQYNGSKKTIMVVKQQFAVKKNVYIYIYFQYHDVFSKQKRLVGAKIWETGSSTKTT